MRLGISKYANYEIYMQNANVMQPNLAYFKGIVLNVEKNTNSLHWLELDEKIDSTPMCIIKLEPGIN